VEYYNIGLLRLLLEYVHDVQKTATKTTTKTLSEEKRKKRKNNSLLDCYQRLIASLLHLCNQLLFIIILSWDEKRKKICLAPWWFFRLCLVTPVLKFPLFSLLFCSAIRSLEWNSYSSVEWGENYNDECAVFLMNIIQKCKYNFFLKNTKQRQLIM
jgi:hypothetical protein